MNYAPIVLFVYNRLEHTRRTLTALSNNELADQSELFIFADGAKEDADAEQKEKITKTRAILTEQQWCKDVNIILSETNKGLAKSVIDGVTQIIKQYGKVIVLEDDIVTGKYFLRFMNESLEQYKNEDKIWHISGWRYPVKTKLYDTAYIYPTMNCWGWATWSDRWQYFEKDPSHLISIFTPKMREKFNADGAYPGFWEQIESNASGKLNTWAIFWYAAIFLHNGFCVGPTSSLVKNIGIDASGTNVTAIEKRLITKKSIDNLITNFPDKIEINEIEYKKNKKLMVKLNKKNPLRIFAKKILKSIGLFDIMKKAYYKRMQKKI